MTDTSQRKSVEKVANDVREKIREHCFNKTETGHSLNMTEMKTILIESITTLLAEREAELVRRVESLSDVVIIEHEMDCQKGRRPCGAVEHPHQLADRCSIRRHDQTAINEALTIIKEVFKK